MTPQETKKLFKALGLKSRMDGASCGGDWFASSGDWLEVHNPTNGDLLAKIQQAGEADYAKLMEQAGKAFRRWRAIPAPKRGEIVRNIGVALRARKGRAGTTRFPGDGKDPHRGPG